MRSLERDYKYLLLKLVPYHRLDRERRRHISRALESGDATAMRRAAVQALDDLCGSGHFTRAGTSVNNGNSVVTYVPRAGNFQLRLQVPTDELEASARGTPRTAETGVDVTIDVIPGIIGAFSITQQSMYERLETTVGRLASWFVMTAVRLRLVQERLGEESEGETVTAEPEANILKQAANMHCKRTGEIELLHPQAAIALGMSKPDGQSLPGTNVGRVAVSPIFAAGEFWGVLECWLPDGDDGPMARSRIEVATGMIEQIIENAIHLENLTSMDKLTEIYNRNFYDAQVPIEVERAKRSGTHLTMLIADIDDFKSINDTHGHSTGDDALMLTAQLIKRNLRRIDLAFRYGGEEFVILLPGTAQVEAIHTAERVRSVIEKVTELHTADGRSIPLRVSIGAAVYPNDAQSHEELFNKADKALYRAKHQGKNRVEFYGDS